MTVAWTGTHRQDHCGAYLRANTGRLCRPAPRPRPALRRCLRRPSSYLEATGSYSIALAVTLHAAGYQLSVINPLQAHHFAKAQLRRAKTDALDAADLARLAATLTLPRWTPPPAVYHEVRQRLLARDGLMTMRQQARNQHHALMQWPVVVAAVQTQLNAVIADLDARITTLEGEIAVVLASSEWAESLACLTSAPGIGVLTAAWLLVTTLNFTTATSAEAVVAYAGLAPMPRQSGTSLRGTARIGHGGNSHLRTAVYLATLSAARYNPQIRAFYERLRAAGKPVKVARCAAARKLIHLAWALVTKQHGSRSIIAIRHSPLDNQYRISGQLRGSEAVARDKAVPVTRTTEGEHGRAVHRGGTESEANIECERMGASPLARWDSRHRRFNAAYLRRGILTHAPSVVSGRSPVRATAEQRAAHERQGPFSTCSPISVHGRFDPKVVSAIA